MKAARRNAPDRWRSVQWPTERSGEWTARLAADERIEAIIAIGSASRGQAGPASDVDLVVVYSGERMRMIAPPEMDVRWIEVAKLRGAIERGDDVFAWAVAFGLPLHDPRGIWERMVADCRDRLPLPTPEVCSARAERARRYAADLVNAGDDEAAAEQALTMLTHAARRVLCEHRVFPASRPELVGQLERIGAAKLASLLERAIARSLHPRDALEGFAELAREHSAS